MTWRHLIIGKWQGWKAGGRDQVLKSSRAVGDGQVFHRLLAHSPSVPIQRISDATKMRGAGEGGGEYEAAWPPSRTRIFRATLRRSQTTTPVRLGVKRLVGWNGVGGSSRRFSRPDHRTCDCKQREGTISKNVRCTSTPSKAEHE